MEHTSYLFNPSTPVRSDPITARHPLECIDHAE